MKPKNYNDFEERHVYAKKQLAVINNYALDFKEIVSGLMSDKGDKDKEGVAQMMQSHKAQGLIIWLKLVNIDLNCKTTNKSNNKLKIFETFILCAQFL